MKYFVLKNYKTREKLTCCWSHTHSHFGQKVYYIGVSEGLGGYNYMISQGWVDRRTEKVKQQSSKYENLKSNLDSQKALAKIRDTCIQNKSDIVSKYGSQQYNLYYSEILNCLNEIQNKLR